MLQIFSDHPRDSSFEQMQCSDAQHLDVDLSYRFRYNRAEKVAPVKKHLALDPARFHIQDIQLCPQVEEALTLNFLVTEMRPD